MNVNFFNSENEGTVVNRFLYLGIEVLIYKKQIFIKANFVVLFIIFVIFKYSKKLYVFNIR